MPSDPLPQPDSFGALTEQVGSLPATGPRPLPPHLGQGTLSVFEPAPRLRLLLYQVALTQELQLQRAGASAGASTVTFSFRHLTPLGGAAGPAAAGTRQLPVVQVASAALDLALRFPAHTPLVGILIAAEDGLLGELLGPGELPGILQSIVAGQHQALYEGVVTPAMQEVATAIFAHAATAPLPNYYLRLRAEELMYLFLAELLKRAHAPALPISAADARRLYVVRDHLLADLSEPPSLPALARLGGLSESKLKRLFKQVFGDTVHHYFQTVRLREAARLLHEQQLSVTEVAYQLGFQNLSHFGRLFERYSGLKPKKYSKAAGAGQL